MCARVRQRLFLVIVWMQVVACWHLRAIHFNKQQELDTLLSSR